MKNHINRRVQQITSRWTGGTSTELAIFPAGSLYSNRDFSFRISTATIDLEESGFTPLPGIKRVLMVLDGDLQLYHEGRYGKRLQKFETERFSGDWITVSYGTGVDFNLMTRGNFRGDIEGFNLQEKSEREILTRRFTGVYVVKNAVSIKVNDEEIRLSEKDFFMTEENPGIKMILTADEESEIVLVTVDEE
jgi:uncharacterized protein